jgi:hypothetical protein
VVKLGSELNLFLVLLTLLACWIQLCSSCLSLAPPTSMPFSSSVLCWWQPVTLSPKLGKKKNFCKNQQNLWNHFFGSLFSFLFIAFHWQHWELNLALCLSSRCSITWATPSALSVVVISKIGSALCPGQPDLQSYLCFLMQLGWQTHTQTLFEMGSCNHFCPCWPGTWILPDLCLSNS